MAGRLVEIEGVFEAKVNPETIRKQARTLWDKCPTRRKPVPRNGSGW
jgi:hypothetical protein